MIVGCYTMDLYCDEQGCKNATARHTSDGRGAPPGQFYGETAGECRRAARRAGWKLSRRDGQGHASCPLHRVPPRACP